MRIFAFLLLPACAVAFQSPAPHVLRPSTQLYADFAVSDVVDPVNDCADEVLEKADKWVVSRAMRIVNHAPVLITLQQLASKVGSSKFALDAAPTAFARVAAPSLLAIPTWTYRVWTIICAAQLASVAKSALANDSDELSQSDISALAVSNFAAAKAISCSNPLQWTVATAALSGYAVRNGGDGDVTIHNAALQLMSSFSTIVAVQGTIAALPSVLPFAGGAEVLAGLGLAAYYGMATRGGNTTVKKCVLGGVLGGMLWPKLFPFNMANISVSSVLSVGTLVTAASAFVAYTAIKKAVDALK